MTTVHARLVGRDVIVPRSELDVLLELARRSEPVAFEAIADDVPAWGIAHVAEAGHAYDFLRDEPDEYSVADLKVRYR